MFYEIREMREIDSKAVLEIFQQGIDSQMATFDLDVPTWEAWDIKHLNICRLVLVDEGNAVIGWAALQPISSRACYNGVAEVSIYIRNDFHHKGLGTQLLQKLILDSEENGIWTLQSGVFPENEASIQLHQKLGFRIVGKREKISKLNGIWMDVILLERRSKVVGI